MKPKRKKDIVTIVAKDNGLREKEVHEAVSVYWEAIAAHIAGLKTMDIRIHGMGTFCFTRSKIEILQANLQRRVSEGKGAPYTLKLLEQIQQLEVLKQQRQANYDKRAATQQRKADYQAKKALDK